MEGSIHVISKVGEGTTVELEIELPLGERPPSVEMDRIALEGLRVLVVDDQIINRRVVVEQLQHSGMICHACESGAAALEMLSAAAEESQPYHIAILDYQMPEIDGEELALRIKADPQLASTLLIMLSSCGRPGEAAVLRKAGIVAYLSKPVGRDELLETLKSAWGLSQSENGDDHLITRHSLRETREAHSQEPPSTAKPPPLQGRVLLAEDNLVNQKLAIRLLERMGLQVDLAENGRQVLEIYGSAPYDIILIDCQMPEMDGYEATREIRKREAGGSHIPIVAMTASAMQGDRDRCLASGMDDYLSKPIKAEGLRAMVERWLEGSSP